MSNCTDAYLLCPPGQPVRLVPGQELTIGRDDSNRMVLPYNDVSRFHARIYYGDNQWMLEDLKSANGTMLNDKYIQIASLNDGDQLTLGEHIIFYREGHFEMPGHAYKETMRIPQKDKLRAPPAWQGDIKSLSLGTILQVLSAEQKTGCLQITTKTGKAYTFLKEGMLIHCEFGQQTGIDAFFALLNMSEGNFDFKDDMLPSQTTMNHPIEMLLLEYARVKDEQSRES